MKKGIAIVFALGAVVGFVAYKAIKQLKDELETGLPMDPDDFGSAAEMHDNCECDCNGDCNGDCECHRSEENVAPEASNP